MEQKYPLQQMMLGDLDSYMQKNETISRIFPDHKGLKLETNLKEKNSKTLKLMEIE